MHGTAEFLNALRCVAIALAIATAINLAMAWVLLPFHGGIQ